VTEVMSEDDVPMVAEYADILQIGSRSMENYSLLGGGAFGRPVLLKRGMVATIADLLRSAQVILDNGNPNVILCERGIRTFETATRNTFDVAAIALLKQISHLPVIADPSHAAGIAIWFLRWRASQLPPARMAAGRGASQSRQGLERRRPVAGLCRIRRDDGRARAVDGTARNGGSEGAVRGANGGSCGPWRQWDESCLLQSAGDCRDGCLADSGCGFAPNAQRKASGREHRRGHHRHRRAGL
jgi:hypothetical protein